MTIFLDSDDLRDLKVTFAHSVKDRTNEIEQILLGLESVKSPEKYRELIRSIMSEIHSIKGASLAYGMNEGSIICHKFEDMLTEILNQVRVSSSKDVESMLVYVDALECYFNEIIKNKVVDFKDIKEKFPGIFQGTREGIEGGAQQETACLNILLVGFTKTIIKQIYLALTGLNFKIAFATNPLDGLHRLSHEKFDLVFSSYMMNPINGASFCSAVKVQWGVLSPKIVLFPTEKIPHISNDKIAPDHVILKSLDLAEDLRKYLFKELNLSVNEGKYLKKEDSSEKKKFNSSNKIRKVYFIDDDENILRLIAKIFQAKKEVTSYTKVTIENPLNDLIKFKPDLIVSDINIPKINTLELLKSIKKNEVLKDVPVVFLTGNVSQENCKDLLDSGAQAIFEKGIILDRFFVELKKKGFEF